MKRVLSVVLCLLMLVVLLSGCMKQRYYKEQNIENYNYNNISARADVWFDGEGVYFVQKVLISFMLCGITADGTERYFEYSGFSPIQKVADKIYYIEESVDNEEQWELIVFDVNTKVKKTLYTTEAYNIDSFYVVENMLYFVKYSFSYSSSELYAVNLSSGEEILVSDMVFSCGVVNGKLRYLRNFELDVFAYEYEPTTCISNRIGEFCLELYGANDYVDEYANFTENYVIIDSGKVGQSKLQVYDLQNMMLNSVEFKGTIYNHIAYENFTYLQVVEYIEDTEQDLNTLYRVNLQTMEVQKLDELDWYCSIFVASDEDLYVYDWNEDKYYHYFADGTREEIVYDRKVAA